MPDMSDEYDDLSEVDLTEADIDAMLAEGTPVTITTVFPGAPSARLPELDVHVGVGLAASVPGLSALGVSTGTTARPLLV